MWTTYQHTEIPMPFVMSSRGWGVFNNATRKNFFDIGYTEKDVFNIFNTFDEADFYLFCGTSMKDVLRLYTCVTGGNYVLPKWAYGLCFGPNMREDQWDILNDAVFFRQLQVPCDVFWLEPQWMEKRYDFSTAKRWNFDKFSPEPYWLQDKYPKQLYNRLFVGKLRNMGFHLGLWLCEEYDLSITEEDEIAAREGRPQSGQEHWMDHLKTFLDYGVEGFKMDPARTIDEHPDAAYFNGRTDKEMHNLNQVLLQKPDEPDVPQARGETHLVSLYGRLGGHAALGCLDQRRQRRRQDRPLRPAELGQQCLYEPFLRCDERTEGTGDAGPAFRAFPALGSD